MSEGIDTFLALTRTATREEVVVWYNTLTNEEKNELKAYVGPIIAKIVEAWEAFKEATSEDEDVS